MAPFRTFVSLLISAVGLLTAACHEFYAVSGQVVACDSKDPIENAEVLLNVPELERKGKTTTDVEGQFQVAVNYPSADLPGELSVSKSGYTPSRLKVPDPRVKQQLCLKPVK